MLYQKENFDGAMELIEKKMECATTDLEKAIVYEKKGAFFLALYRMQDDKGALALARQNFEKGLSLSTEHDEIIIWRLAVLMRHAKNYPQSVHYINKLLKMDTNNDEDYLSLALEVAVDMGDWSQAKELVNILYSRYRQYVLSIPSLLATVKTFCHHDKPDIAKKFIDGVKKIRTNLNETEEKLMSEAEFIQINSCNPKEWRKGER